MVRVSAIGLLLAHWLLLASCAARIDEPWRWPSVDPPAGAAPGVGLVPVRVAVAPSLVPLMERLEPYYEAARPGVDLVIHAGPKTGEVDPARWLALRLERGAEADAFLAESMGQVDALEREVQGSMAWLGNTLAVVVPRGSTLDRRELALGRAPVHIALQRSELGRWTRASLRESELWGDVSLAAGVFDDGSAIIERVRYFYEQTTPQRGRQESFGIVFGSDAHAAQDRVRVVGYLDQPRGDPLVHAIAWFTDEGAALASWLAESEDARVAAARGGFIVGGPR
ncbi:MAG: substrate-binding domain-containing protein [Planctomycetota bacterium]